MALTIIHSIASWFLRKRIDQIEEFIKRPHEVQENVCAKLLEAAQSTEMGKQYDFISIRNYEDFASRIPISIYEDIEPMIERARRGEQNLSGVLLSSGLPKVAVQPMPKVSLSL